MDTLTEDFARSDADDEMTVLHPEDITEQNVNPGDEVEDLQNSLREAVHDDNVRPKMQCLMMDSSFSMVTMQGEDSGIAWETTPSRCTTPWASEVGNPTVEHCSPAAVRPATPGSHSAGKIIFVMDEELISRRKKTKERVSSQKSQADGQQEDPVGSSENISGRPELVGVSQPNVKTEGGDEEELADPLVDKEQQLFSLVSEGSEILNIVVPPKLATVDEEESKEMVDNLSYLEDSPVPKASDESLDYEMLISIDAPVVSGAAGGDQVRPPPPSNTQVMDPPGAPVARPLGRGDAGNVDYFEAFTLIDAQAPGSPAVIAERGVGPEAEVTIEGQSKDTTTSKTAVDYEMLDSISLEEITGELLDEVFYGGTDDYLMKSPDREDGAGAAEGVPCRLPSKPSGSNLFGSQEDILTPIFLPEGPPKIIDPILLEEPKAMSFLYTDLYEEAIGSRKKDEDTESMTSEKSFHSRNSDREARGYLEKYALIDETPVLEGDPANTEKCPEEGPRMLTQDLYSDFLSKPEKVRVPNSEEEITDFFRSSANSSPCDVDPFPRSPEEDETQPTTKSKARTNKSVSITVEKVTEIPGDPLSISSFEFPSEDPDWESMDEALIENDVIVHTAQELQKPVAPPRKKSMSSLKACLDLTPLTPVDVPIQEKEEAGGKEKREEEKETASPTETADEGDGDAEETMQPPSKVYLSEHELAAVETGSTQTQSVKDSEEINVRDTQPTAVEEKDSKTVEEKSETSPEQSQSEDIENTESAKTEINPEKQEDTAATQTEPAKAKGQCIIL
ncbi:cardiomyopathy-associated protein 5 [Mastacembelus armatus]|uniref:cardiomyopathy-associated protein 5 n=1 Tax=Mastacembelus armatus TaxID=205130 RepID=UPI000E4615C9|nr:cardiomyopathy-associated protein 5-like [Mastacembelus armatus]